MLYLPLPLLSLCGSLIAVGRFGACFHLVLGGSCIWLPPAGHGLRAEVGGGIFFVAPGELAGQRKTPACQICEKICGVYAIKLYMLASAGQPSLHGYDACMVYWTEGAHRRNCMQKQRETSFSPLWVFLLSRNSRERFWGLILWHLWIGRAQHPGLAPCPNM